MANDTRQEGDRPSEGSDSELSEVTHNSHTIDSFLKCVQSVRRTPFILPKTVSLIECSGGTKVYLIGTAHFSKESITDVRFIMKNTLPDIVVVELCANRAHSMLLSEEDIKQQIRESSLITYIKNMGVSNGITQYLLLRFTSYIMNQIGMAPGGEFRAAFHEASNQTHCHIILGDRPIKITLQRAIDALGLWRKIKFCCTLLFSFEKITPEDVEEMKREDLLEQLIKTLAGDYPELTRIILEERDLYLARSIWEACGFSMEEANSCDKQRNKTLEIAKEEEESGRQGQKDTEGPADPASTNEFLNLTSYHCCPQWPALDVLPRVVVAVVGIGHVAGIKKAWNYAATIDKADLRRVKPTSRSLTLFRLASQGLILSALSFTGYWAVRGVYWTAHYLFHGAFNLFRNPLAS